MPPATRIRAFLLLFAALFLLALILAIAAEFSDAKWIQAAVSIGDRLEPLTVIAIAVTFLSVEGVPMLASWVRREEIKEARAQGRTEGHAEGRIEGRAEGRAEGRTEGHAEGRVEGYAEGSTAGRALEREAWQEWQRKLAEWEQRKSRAENEGRDFQEPRPASPSEN